jgi:2-hydroxychromene-2-carboxylate isomerase
MANQSVAFYFDPACPWTWNTSRWLIEVARARGLAVEWRPLSLSVLHAGENIPEQYRGAMEAGHAALRIVAALQATGRHDAIGELYTEFGRRMFYDGAHASAALAADAAEAVGLGDVASAAASASYDAAVEASTREGMDLAGPDVGSPVIVAGEGIRAFHGPIVSPPPTGDDALRLWDALTALARIPSFYELKHGRRGGTRFGPRP